VLDRTGGQRRCSALAETGGGDEAGRRIDDVVPLDRRATQAQPLRRGVEAWQEALEL
jgi:hypothetical protein